jgi:hypothetical protein
VEGDIPYLGLDFERLAGAYPDYGAGGKPASERGAGTWRHWPGCQSPRCQYTYSHFNSLEPCMIILQEGQAVSLCRSVRKSEILHECGVDTIAAERHKGFGEAVVRAWASLLWGRGVFPLYSTQWNNKGSIALAAKLKGVQIAADIFVSKDEGS